MRRRNLKIKTNPNKSAFSLVCTSTGKLAKPFIYADTVCLDLPTVEFYSSQAVLARLSKIEESLTNVIETYNEGFTQVDEALIEQQQINTRLVEVLFSNTEQGKPRNE